MALEWKKLRSKELGISNLVISKSIRVVLNDLKRKGKSFHNLERIKKTVFENQNHLFLPSVAYDHNASSAPSLLIRMVSVWFTENRNEKSYWEKKLSTKDLSL